MRGISGSGVVLAGCLLGAGVLLAGCGGTARSIGMADGEVLITTAEHRAVTRTKRDDLQVTCTEPSPDVATIASASFNTGLEGKAGALGGLPNPELSFQLAMARSQALAQLGQRLGTIQLLRDGLYRACEAYANGAIDKPIYAQIVSRYDDVMVTLLLAEFVATGNRPPQLARLGGSAGAAIPKPESGTGESDGAERSDEKVRAGTQTDHAAVGGATTPQAGKNADVGSDIATALATMQATYLADINLDAFMTGCHAALHEDSRKKDTTGTETRKNLVQICATFANSLKPADFMNLRMANMLLQEPGAPRTFQEKRQAFEMLKAAMQGAGSNQCVTPSPAACQVTEDGRDPE